MAACAASRAQSRPICSTSRSTESNRIWPRTQPTMSIVIGHPYSGRPGLGPPGLGGQVEDESLGGVRTSPSNWGLVPTDNAAG